jgi:tetratricopeptide (TPR) repeat protein
MTLRVLPVLLLLTGCAPKQEQPAASGEKPPALLKGLGVHTHKIETSNPEAQKFFDQGLTLLYGFNRYEALRSFRRASELDPKALMPQWGIAIAQGPHVNMDIDGDYNPKEYCAAIERGRSLAGSGDHERLYLDAAAARCPEHDPASYIQATRALAQRFPDDMDALTLLAEALMIPVRWRWWTPEGKPADGVQEAVDLLEQVLRRNPAHPGANHFYIHAVENSPSPERAIPSAQRLMGIVPAAGHLVHMPGHIWLILGDYELAATVNERAAQVDVDYMKTTGVTASAYAGYYVHNLHFVAVARAMQGRKADAIEAARKVAQSATPYIADMPQMVDAFIPLPLFAHLRFGMWDEVLAEAPPDARLLAATAMHHYARGVALAAKGRLEEARKERDAFQQAAAKVPADWIWLNNQARDMVAIAREVLNARLAGGDAAAIPYWRKAVTLEDNLVYDEPPPWFFPIRESLGGALLRSGQAAEAEAVFREGIRRKPRSGRLLFGLLESLKAQGKTAAAALVQKEFDAAWKRADVQLRVEDL